MITQNAAAKMLTGLSVQKSALGYVDLEFYIASHQIEGTAMLQLPWDELVGRWKHYVVTFDNSVKGISAAYMDGIPIYVIHTMVL